jgi:hypothetical protein
MLCRSCVEAGVATKLDQKNLVKEREALPYGNMKAMLRLARTKEIMDELTFQLADEIRESARKTIHQSAAPSEAECRKMLENTRAVLRSLYE